LLLKASNELKIYVNELKKSLVNQKNALAKIGKVKVRNF
jgi:hypothetical protein